MAAYTRRNPVRELGTDTDGTRTAAVEALGRRHFTDNNDRLPAFAGLAKFTGGYYAENPDGTTLEKAMAAARMDYTVKFQQDTAAPAMPDASSSDYTDYTDDTVDTDGQHNAINGVSDDGPPMVTVTTFDRGEMVTVQYPFRGTYAEWPNGDRVGFGMVRSRYQIVQPQAAGELGQALIDEGGANCVAAGIYGNPAGARSYLAFKLPEGMTIGGEDQHDLYLTILNSYDGQTGLTGLFAPIRLACTNMTTATFGRGRKKVSNRFTFQHSGNIDDKIEKAREALGVASEWTQHWQRAAEDLLKTRLVGAELDAFLNKVLPTPNSVTTDSGERAWTRRRIEMKDIITKSGTCEFGRGTAYAAYQGAVEWADWLSDTKKGASAGDIMRFTRTLNGTDTEKIKLRAAELLGV